MKVGIITYQYAYNYGAVLQCLALQRTLTNLGVDASAINYLPPDSFPAPIWRGWGLRNGKFIESLHKKYIKLRYLTPAKNMRKAFNDFRSDHLQLSTPCITSEEISNVTKEYDALVAGSDQVWHFSRPPMYFLEWGTLFAGKRISYAPCCGTREQDPAKFAEIKKYLSRFDHISVRNDFSQEVIAEVTEKQVPVVCDPTLLMDLNDVQKKVELPCSEYILMYTLGKEINGSHKKAIQSIRKKVGNIPVVAIIATAHQPHLAPWADIKILDAGPAEWLYLIAHAKLVYTDSFHGALFSIKNKTPFFAYYAQKDRSPRLIDLAERYQIQSCVGGSVAEGDKKEWGILLDYEKNLSLISQHKKKSLAYLKMALTT